jgi:hypothetical protein
MIGDLLNALFRSGVPYDAHTNTFKVGPEDAHRIQHAQQEIYDEENWFRRSHTTQRARGWDDFDF